MPAGPVNIGIILTPEARRKGWAREAIGLVLSWVFDDMGYHRVQASILDSHCKDQAISMFTKLYVPVCLISMCEPFLKPFIVGDLSMRVSSVDLYTARMRLYGKM